MGQLRPRVDPADVQAVIERARLRVGMRASAGLAEGHAVDSDLLGRSPGQGTAGFAPSTGDAGRRLGVFGTVDAAVAAAGRAQRAYQEAGSELRAAAVAALREAMRERALELARRARAETGLGRAEDKLRKNLLVIERTPGPEDLETETRSGDRGLTLVERAPYGLIGAITPSTNPTATIINNAICAISAGNGIVFNAHPRARGVSADAVAWINEALLEAGAPPDLVACIDPPTIESAQALMHHPGLRLLLVTGGPAVVREARRSGKKAILAGPGNPPVVVDETADLRRAGQGIVAGASFDNNLICTDEKEVFVVASVADALLREMVRAGAYLLKPHQLRRLERVIFERMGPPMKPGKIDPRWIGQDAARILSQIGVQAGDELRLVVAEVPLEHGLVWTEQMMPVLPVVRVKDADTAMDMAVRAEHGFGHTASIYSRDVERITRMARAIDVSIFVANGPNYAGLGEGGEGYTSFSIASPTGEGLTRPRTFSRERRVTMVDALRAV